MTDAFTKSVRSRVMSSIRKTDSKPEQTVRKYLHSKGIRYRKNVKNILGCPDIVLPKYETIMSTVVSGMHIKIVNTTKCQNLTVNIGYQKLIEMLREILLMEKSFKRWDGKSWFYGNVKLSGTTNKNIWIN